jgi:hypothetical protein
MEECNEITHISNLIPLWIEDMENTSRLHDQWGSIRKYKWFNSCANMEGDYKTYCESPIEENFIHKFLMQKHSALEVYSQVEILNGIFRLDFLLRWDNDFVCIECDGKQWHNKEKDKTRDEIINCKTDIKITLRFPGNMLYWSPYRAILRIKEIRPNWITRSKENIEHFIRSDEAHELVRLVGDSFIKIKDDEDFECETDECFE